MSSVSVENFTAKPLAPGVRAYLISGDETQLIEEARAHVRGAFNPENIYRADVDSIQSSGITEPRGMSLFGGNAAELFDITGLSAPTKKNADVLAAFVADIKAPNVALCALYTLETKHHKAAWFKKINEVALHIRADVPNTQAAKGWIQRFATAVSVRLDEDGLALLAAQTEGNLAAAKQALAKIALTGDAGDISTVRAALADGACYDIFDLKDAILSGEGSRTVLILHHLLAANVATPIIVWLISDIVDNLLAAQCGKPIRAWGTQATALWALAERITPTTLNGLLQKTAYADRLGKGVATGDITTTLIDLVIRLAALKRGVKITLPTYQP